MRKPSKSSAKRTKLEPLSVEEALSSPSVEGMFSFLNIRPEELVRPRSLSDFIPRTVPCPVDSDIPYPVNDSGLHAVTPSPGLELTSTPGPLLNQNQDPHREPYYSPDDKRTSSPGIEMNIIPGSKLNIIPGPQLNIIPGSSSAINPSPPPAQHKPDTKTDDFVPLDERIKSRRDNKPQDDTITRTASNTDSGGGGWSNSSPGPILTATSQNHSVGVNDQITVPATHSTEPRSKEFSLSPGLELKSDSARSLLVSEVRYTIRRAKLVQDGHTSNEQKLYEYLWTHGTVYDDVSRRVSMGFRTLAEKVRMARASAQRNLRALAQKLALEIIEGFDVTSSKAATYRVFNYAEILRRRDMAGMIWYVRRTQAVRFVDAKGQEMVPEVYLKPGLVFNNSPGLIFDDDPGPILRPEPGLNIISDPGLELRPHFREQDTERKTNESTSSSQTLPDEYIEALQALVPSIDRQALSVLWSECRARVPDCSVQEILYFTRQKAGVCRNGKIQNPVGFLLASVPKCFEEQPFENFRRDQKRLKDEQQRREESERQKAQRVDEQIRNEEEAYRKTEERLQALPKDDFDALYERANTELAKLVPKLSSWTPEARERSVRSRMIRELQRT